MNNLVRVSWSGAMTDYFRALNGVKQGAVLSLILYWRSFVNTFQGGRRLFYWSTLCRRTCIGLRGLPLSAMRKILAICKDYAREYNISFNALKSKCLVALPKNCRCHIYMFIMWRSVMCVSVGTEAETIHAAERRGRIRVAPPQIRASGSDGGAL